MFEFRRKNIRNGNVNPVSVLLNSIWQCIKFQKMWRTCVWCVICLLSCVSQASKHWKKPVYLCSCHCPHGLSCFRVETGLLCWRNFLSLVAPEFVFSECQNEHPVNDYFIHDDVIKWNHFPCYRPFVWEIHRSAMNSPHKGQWRGALIFSLIRAWTNSWVYNRGAACDLRRHRAHGDVRVMSTLHRLQTRFKTSYVNKIIPGSIKKFKKRGSNRHNSLRPSDAYMLR